MKTKEIYNKILWLGLAMVFIFSPVAKGAVQVWSITPIELIILLLVFIWLWKANNNAERLRRTKIDLPIWLFLGLAIISCYFSIYKYASLLEMLRLIMIVGIYYLVVNNFDRKMTLRLVALLIIIATSLSLLGLAQYFLGLEHSWWVPEDFLASTYVNHNHFAGYLELVIPLAIGIILGLKRENVFSTFQFWSFRLSLIISLMIMSAAFIFSQSRGAWISLVICLIVMNNVLIKKRILKKQSLFVFLLVITLGLAFLLGGYDIVAERLHTVEQAGSEASLGTRIKIWQGAINMIKANPLIGTGIGTFDWGFQAYRPEGLRVRAYFAHNDYLHMMAEMGLLALPLMLWMIWVVVTAGFKWKEDKGQDAGGDNYKHEKKSRLTLTEGVVLGAAVGVLSLSLHGLVDFNFHIPANMLVVAALSGIIARRASKNI